MRDRLADILAGSAVFEEVAIVPSGWRGADRREGIVQNLLLPLVERVSRGRQKGPGDTARLATSGEIRDRRREASALKEVLPS
jgi:transposase